MQTWKDSRPFLLSRLLYESQGRRECSITSLLLGLFFHMTRAGSHLKAQADGGNWAERVRISLLFLELS